MVGSPKEEIISSGGSTMFTKAMIAKAMSIDHGKSIRRCDGESKEHGNTKSTKGVARAHL